jgi:uncharacterized protein
MSLILLLAVAVVVGVCIGAAGVGGVLLIPALQMLTPLTVHASMATALFTFVFTGIVGTVLFQRRGSIDWGLTVPLCAGGALFGIVGAWAAARLDGRVLTLVLAVLIVLAGVYTVVGGRAATSTPFAGQPGRRRVVLFTIGALTGFGSGLTGVGGPALAVPMMVLLGFPAIVAVGASQVVQIVAAVSGSLGHLGEGTIDFTLAAWLTGFEVAGVVGGVALAHRIDARTLRLGVGLLCVAVGLGLLWRSL